MKLIAVLFLLFPTVLFAQSEFVPLQERAQGQSLSAANLLNDAVFSNPASASFIQTYSLEGIYSMPKNMAVSILDTKTSDFGAGLGYFRKNVPGQDPVLQGVRLSLSSRVSDGFGIGFAGKALWGPTTQGINTKMQDLDIGWVGRLSWVQVGMTLRNAIGGSKELEMDREWNLGVRLGYLDTVFFSTQMDASWGNIKPYQVGFGAEYVSPYYFAIKGGYRFDPSGYSQTWSAGASFLAPHISLHYAAEFPNEKDMEHTFSAMFLL